MNVLSCVYNEIQNLYRRFNTTIKSSTEVNYLTCHIYVNNNNYYNNMYNKVSDVACL